MTHTTERKDATGGQPIGDVYELSAAALDSAEELLRAHQAGTQLSDAARASISNLLSDALRYLHALQLAGETSGELDRRASDGLRRFDKLLRQTAEAGLLPER